MLNRSIIALLAVAVAQCLSSKLALSQDTPTSVAPGGYLLIEEEQWNMLSDEPSRHLGRARDALLIMDAREAASEIRKAAVHLRIAASHAKERTKRSLVRSEHELEQLAQRIEQGTQKSMEEFDLAASRALHALSNDQYARASEAWRKRELRKSGQLLRASIDNLERAAAKTDATFRHATAVVVKDTRVISGKLIDGTGFVIDEVGDGFERAGHAIERLGTRVEHDAPR